MLASPFHAGDDDAVILVDKVRPNRVADSKLHSITSSARASSVGGTVEAERLGGLEVDHQLVFGRRLHRQIGWLLALEDAVDVAGRVPILVDENQAPYEIRPPAVTK